MPGRIILSGPQKIDFPIHKPIIDLTKAQYQLLWEGNKELNGIDDFFKEVEKNLYKVSTGYCYPATGEERSARIAMVTGLRKEALYVKIGDKHIGELCEMPVEKLQEWFSGVEFSSYQQQVAKRILIEIHNRLKTLLDVGLGYLTLNRLANSLSGGESQRIQLTRSPGQQSHQFIIYIG